MRIQSILTQRGACSSFGGPRDTGLANDEGLALVTAHDAVMPAYRGLFLPDLDITKGLARQLNPDTFYCSMRWTSTLVACLRAPSTMIAVTSAAGRTVWCRPVDFGPGLRTHRIIDLSPGAMSALLSFTDDVVEVDVFITTI